VAESIDLDICSDSDCVVDRDALLSMVSVIVDDFPSVILCVLVSEKFFEKLRVRLLGNELDTEKVPLEELRVEVNGMRREIETVLRSVNDAPLYDRVCSAEILHVLFLVVPVELASIE